MMDDSFRGSRTVTAMFDDAGEAERAMARLRAAGIPDASIRHTQGSQGGAGSTDTTYRDQHKGFWDSLGDFFFPDDDRYTYAEGLARGSHMVTVTGFDAAMYDTVVDILDDEGSIDLDARESEWRSSGWSGYQGAPRYADPGDISGTGGMAGATSGLAGTSAGLGTVIDPPDTGEGRPLTEDSNTRGTIYDDGRQDSTIQMAAEMGRRSQADLGSQQVGTGDQGLGGTGLGSTGGLGTGTVPGSMNNPDGTVNTAGTHTSLGQRDTSLGSGRVRSYTHG